MYGSFFQYPSHALSGQNGMVNISKMRRNGAKDSTRLKNTSSALVTCAVYMGVLTFDFDYVMLKLSKYQIYQPL